jgi:transcriptional regulator with XRE-family HTH domain
MPSPEATLLLPRLRAHFNLSQEALGKCLGLSRTMVSQVERGIRPLPLPAALPQAALTLALHRTPAEPEPEALDRAALHKHQRACQHRAEQLTYALSLLPARAAWARRRLAALPVLTAALAPAGTAAPAWLTGFAAEARAELARSGSTAQARLRGRIAGLLTEAAAAAQELAATD